MEDKVKDFLRNMETEKLFSLARDINGYDGSLDWLDYWENDEEFYDLFFKENPMELARAIYYGDYNYMDDYIKFDAYGNLETANEFSLEHELRDSIDEIAEKLIELKDNLYLSDELKELLQEGDDK